MEKREKAKTTKIQRIRKRLHLTINPENYEYIKNNGLNASRLVDTVLNELQTKTKRELVFICENKPQAGVEPATSSLPRTRYATKPLRQI